MKDNDHEEIVVSREGIDASLSTLVSIFLIVLAFLATMHSVSSLKLARVGATLHSVNSAFAGRITSTPHDVVEIDAEQAGATARGGNQPFLEAGAFLLYDSLSIEGGEAIKLGGSLETDIPANRIFVGVSGLVRPEFDEFSKELVLLLQGGGERERREVEFVFGFENEQERRFAVARSESLARNLIDQGAEGKNIVVGVHRGPSGRVIVRFRSRLDAGARVDYAGY